MKNKIIESSFSDLLYLVFATFITMFLQVGTAALSAQILGSEGYGKLSLFLLVAQLIFLFGVSWTSASIIRYGREEFIKTGKINKTFWGRNVILILTLIVLFVLLFIFRERVIKYICLKEPAFLLLIFYIIGNVFLNYTQYIQQAIGQLRLFAATKIVQKSFAVFGLLCVFMISSVPKNVMSVVIVAVVSFFGTASLSMFFLKKKYFFPIEIDRAYIKKILNFSYPIILGSGSAYIVSYIDIIVIKRYLRIADVGVYSLSYQMFMVLQSISMSLIVVLGPMMVTFLTEDREDLIRRFVVRIVRQGILFWSIFLAIIVCFAPVLVPMVFGENFRGGVWPFSILMFGLAFKCIAIFYSPILTAYELVKHMMFVNVIMAIINLVGDFILVPRVGISGAAIASSFSFAFSAILYLVIANKRLKLREWHQLLVVAPALFMLLISLFFKETLFQCAGLFLILGTTMFVVRKSKIFSRDDIKIFSRVKMPLFAKKILISTYEFLSD